TLTYNTVLNLVNVKGQNGDKGDKGDKGDTGADGKDGKDGRGIAKTELINGELIITYTDGTSDNLGSISSDITDSISMLNFTRLDDGTLSVAIKEEYKTIAENIVIPSTYNGKTVSTIENNGFENCKYLSHITIPSTINTIGASAFKECSQLNNIVMPDSVTEIGSGAFWQCTSLAEITIPKYVAIIRAATFYNCTSLKTVKLPEGLTTIESHPNGTFGKCTSLNSIILPDSLTYIGGFAFTNCTLLTELTIPKNVVFIGQGSISRTNIKSVYFEEPNGWSSSRLGTIEAVSASTLSNPKDAAERLNRTYYYDGSNSYYSYSRK
ncbi:MAG: leucine-rich repeat domain-containing protein, partial [Eubacterium sp.]|nr:leucine-rich repeat domain-containing protein [Eubacterium sp.]